jgi:hypothetical protein
MIKRIRNQEMFTNTSSDRWLRVAVAVAEPTPADTCAKYWQGRGAGSMSSTMKSVKKRTH